MQARWHIFFSGQVQGVGFRYRSNYLARAYYLTGWVKNLYDGRVEMEVQGELSQIRKFLVQLKGQKYIRIEHMDIEELPLRPEERTFGVDDPYF